MKLITAILARDEAAPDRYLSRVVQRCLDFSDAVLLLDDRSVDRTPEVARSLGCAVRKRVPAREPAWGHETPARQELWQWGVEEAGRGPSSWLLICDADMLLQGDVRGLCHSWQAAAWAWPLADLWNDEQHFRVDGPWAVGPSPARSWLFNIGAIPEGWKPKWSKRGIHSGHAPVNWGEIGPCLTAPPDVYWQHLSYLTLEHRQAKFEAYQAVANQLTEFERAHAMSILDVA